MNWKNGNKVYGEALTGCNWTLGNGWSESNGFYYYNPKLKVGEKSTPLVTNFNANGATTPMEGYSLTIEILAQAIQAEGMGATSAQDAFIKAAAGN